jgi:hypothetical protein
MCVYTVSLHDENMLHTYLRDLDGTQNIISSTLISPPKWIRATLGVQFLSWSQSDAVKLHQDLCHCLAHVSCPQNLGLDKCS